MVILESWMIIKFNNPSVNINTLSTTDKDKPSGATYFDRVVL